MASTSRRTASTLSMAQGSEPRPPASLTAMAIADRFAPAIGAWMIGRSMPSRFWRRLEGQEVSMLLLYRGWGLGTGDSGLGIRDPGSGFRVPGSGFRVPGSGFRVPGSGFGPRLADSAPGSGPRPPS